MRGTMLAAAVLVLAAAGAGRADEAVLNVYNWSDYIGKDTVAKFEKETGITVHYDVYDQNETLEAKLSAGHSGYDVVVPSSIPYLARMAQAHIFSSSTNRSSPTTAILIPRYSRVPPSPIPATSMASPTCGVPPGSATTSTR
jgi:putrescine transport system substrate-binding protein